MVDRCDLAVVGAGSAGLAAATFAARLGARVVLIEKDRIGGDCTWSGCVPSKTLIAEAAREDASSDATVDDRFEQLRARLEATMHRVAAHESPERLRGQGIRVVAGHASFLDAHTLSVGAGTVRAKKVVLCTGARPIIPAIPGLAATPYLTYRTIFQIDRLPRHLIVLGGGPIALELGQAYARLGARITIIERHGELVPAADHEAVRMLRAQLDSDGLTILLGRETRAVRREGDNLCVETDQEDVRGDALLVATGRAPDLEGLHLEHAGIAVKDGAVVVNDHLQTTCPHVYAAGDAIGSYQFTHYAGWQGVIAARNALLPGKERGVRSHVPWTLFTDPELAQVGLTEHQARAEYDRGCRVLHWPMERVDRAQTLSRTAGFIKLIMKADGRLIGGTVVGTETGEIVNELSLAIDRSLKVDDVAAVIHTYPSYGFGLQQACAEAMFERLGSGLSGLALKALVRLP